MNCDDIWCLTMFQTVQIPLMSDKLSTKKRLQLEHLTRRGTMAIKWYLNVISREKDGSLAGMERKVPIECEQAIFNNFDQQTAQTEGKEQQ